MEIARESLNSWCFRAWSEFDGGLTTTTTEIMLAGIIINRAPVPGTTSESIGPRLSAVSIITKQRYLLRFRGFPPKTVSPFGDTKPSFRTSAKAYQPFRTRNVIVRTPFLSSRRFSAPQTFTRPHTDTDTDGKPILFLHSSTE